jgi:DNA invertase Pin-like site-specific DNA recombinase
MNALLYLRVSHQEQVEKGLSLDTQLEELKEYCFENGLAVKKIYRDEGISGSTITKRHAFQNMIAESQSGEVILFTKLDRFSRNLLDALLVVKELTNKNVSVKAIKEEIDTTTTEGRFMFNLMLTLAQREREKTSDRIKDVFDMQIKNGFSVSGKVPYGYMKVDGRYAIDEVPASEIQGLFENYAKYNSLTVATRWWNSVSDRKYEMQEIKKKLKNQIYIGVHPSGLNDYFCEPIVDKELFYDVQEKLKTNVRTRKNNSVFLFSGIIKCNTCGRVMVGNKTTRHYKGKQLYNYYYRCNHAYQDSMCSNRKILSEIKIENAVINALKLALADSNVFVKISTQEKIENEKHKNARNNIKAKISRLQDLYIDGLIDKSSYDVKYNSLIAELDAIPEDFGAKPTAINELKDMNFDELYDKLSRQNKQAFWRKFIEELTILDQEYDVDIHYK